MSWGTVKAIIDTITGVASAGAQVGGTIADAVETQKAREQNQKQFEETMDFNREAIDKQNAQEQLMAQLNNEANARLQEQANATNIAIADKTNLANKEIADQTNALNKAIADQNLGFQREQQEYEENLQKQIFEREDTAYQRTAQDMRNAGMSPLAMNGTNGAGAVVGRTASNNGMVAEGYTANGTTVGATRYEKAQQHLFQKQFREQAKSDMASQIFNGIGEMANQMLDMQNKSAMVKQAEAEARIKQAQATQEEANANYWTSGKSNLGWTSRAEWEDAYRNRENQDKAHQWEKEFNFRKAQDELNRAFADRVQSYNEQMGIVNAITGGIKTIGGFFSPF